METVEPEDASDQSRRDDDQTNTSVLRPALGRKRRIGSEVGRWCFSVGEAHLDYWFFNANNTIIYRPNIKFFENETEQNPAEQNKILSKNKTK